MSGYDLLKGNGVASPSKSFRRTGLADMTSYGALVPLLSLAFTLSLKVHSLIGKYKVLCAPLQFRFTAAPV